MTRAISFTVYGTAAPQGSKSHIGHGVMVESSKAVKPWRQDVVAAALEAIAKQEHWEPFTGPVYLVAHFYFPRPNSHYGTGKNVNTLKDTAPDYVSNRRHGDADKLLRSTCDALTTAGIWRDDSQVAYLTAHKKYHYTPSALIYIKELEP